LEQADSVAAATVKQAAAQAAQTVQLTPAVAVVETQAVKEQ
jgi:hypothetical protein